MEATARPKPFPHPRTGLRGIQPATKFLHINGTRENFWHGCPLKKAFVRSYKYTIIAQPLREIEQGQQEGITKLLFAASAGPRSRLDREWSRIKVNWHRLTFSVLDRIYRYRGKS